MIYKIELVALHNVFTSYANIHYSRYNKKVDIFNIKVK